MPTCCFGKKKSVLSDVFSSIDTKYLCKLSNFVTDVAKMTSIADVAKILLHFVLWKFVIG